MRTTPGLSDTTWRKHVAKAIYTTDGVWGPSTKELARVKPKNLPPRIAAIYRKEKKGFGDVDVFTRKVDGKPIFLFQSAGDGFTSYSLRDTRGRELEMGDKPHEKLPLPHSEEPKRPVSWAQYLTDLKDAMRYPVQVRDTPIVKGDQIPPAIRAITAELAKEKDTYGLSVYDSFEVHKVRVDGRDSYLIYANAEDGVAMLMYTAAGKKLDVM